MCLFARQIRVMLLALLAIVGVQMAWAQQDVFISSYERMMEERLGRPKIAVYVFGAEAPALNKAMATQLITALANTGGYRAAENYKEIFNKLAEEQFGNTLPDPKQITSIGQQFGVEYVCLAWISNISGEKLAGAQIVDVKKMTITASGSSNVPLRTRDDLPVASEQIVTAMSNTATQGIGGSGTFTDKRDGKTYKTVTIGRKTWMTQNLNYKANGSSCYEGKNSNCDKYGRLYPDAGYSGVVVCPSGWHVSTQKEWDDLVTAVGGSSAGKNLKAKNGWAKNGNGTDTYGFSALPGGATVCGCMEADCCDEIGIGNVGRWWAAPKDGDEIETTWGLANTYLRAMFYDKDIVDKNAGDCGDGNTCSVRCVQD